MVVITESELRLFIKKIAREQNMGELLLLIRFQKNRFVPLLLELCRCHECPFYPVVRKILRELKISETVFLQKVNTLKEAFHNEEDPHSILGVSKDATMQEIKSAWRRLIKVYHPDAGSGEQEKVKKINEAYRILSDPELRKKYNNLLQTIHQEKVILITEQESLLENFKWKLLALFSTATLILGIALLVTNHRRTGGYQEVSHADVEDSTFQSSKYSSSPLPEGKISKPALREQILEMKAKEPARKPQQISIYKNHILTNQQESNPRTVIVGAPTFEEAVSREEKKTENVHGSGIGDFQATQNKAVGMQRSDTERNTGQQQNGTENKGTLPVGPEQINAFFALYSKAYSSGDIRRLLVFFAEDARENGVPIQQMIHRYEQLYKNYRVLSFGIKVADYSLSEGILHVKGEFYITLNSESTNHSTSGPISVKINTYRRGINEWKIKELNYRAISRERM